MKDVNFDFIREQRRKSVVAQTLRKMEIERGENVISTHVPNLRTLPQGIPLAELPALCARFGVRVVSRDEYGRALRFDDVHIAPNDGQTQEQADKWAEFIKGNRP